MAPTSGALGKWQQEITGTQEFKNRLGMVGPSLAAQYLGANYKRTPLTQDTGLSPARKSIIVNIPHNVQCQRGSPWAGGSARNGA